MEKIVERPDERKSIQAVAGRFVRFGRIGFWGQLIPLIIGFVLASYVIGIGGQSQSQRYLDISNILSIGFFLIPVFTTFWCLNYMRLGRRMVTASSQPPMKGLRRSAWVGVIAGVIGAALSLLFLFGAVLNLLYVLVSAPQVGLIVTPNSTDVEALSVSAIDGVSLLSLLITLTTELLMIWLSLWLVFTVRAETDQAFEE